MFCPQCGQQQSSDVARFCSRCGFQLEAVSGLLATGGALPPPLALAAQTEVVPASPRRIGARLGGKLMLVGIFLGPVLTMLHEIIGTPEELGLIGVMVFMAGLLRLIYALIFEDGPFRRPKPGLQTYVPPAPLVAPNEASALPPSPGVVPARAYVAPPRVETGEIVYRPSVTEGTTRLLDKERDRERAR